jgi:hypothetical protein
LAKEAAGEALVIQQIVSIREGYVPNYSLRRAAQRAFKDPLIKNHAKDHETREFRVSDIPSLSGALNMETRLLRRSAASDYILSKWGISYKPATLAKLATLGGGPRFSHIGRWPVYALADLDSWVEGRLSPVKSSTSDLSGSCAITEGAR